MTFLVDALATFRLTRLVVRDDITAPLRAKVSGKLETLVSCAWCSSWWLALGVVGARRFFPRLWGPLAQVLAFSAVAGIISEEVG